MKELGFIKLDHIQICIPPGKENEARKFYSDILKLREIPKPTALIPNGGLWYEIAGIQLHIGTEEETCRSKRHPAFEIENIYEARKYLENNGILTLDEKEIPGVIRFTFYDPFGNRIELLEKIPVT